MVMIDLVMCSGDELVMMLVISEWQKISFFYLEQLFGKLCCSKIVESVCGLAGGYYLVKFVDKIMIVEIIVVVDELMDLIS